MARIDLKTYYKNFFGASSSDSEQLKEINFSHAISSKYYDVQFGRSSLLYRDKYSNLVIPIEHDVKHDVVIYLECFLENNECHIPINILRSMISNILNFLKVNFHFG